MQFHFNLLEWPDSIKKRMDIDHNLDLLLYLIKGFKWKSIWTLRDDLLHSQRDSIWYKLILMHKSCTCIKLQKCKILLFVTDSSETSTV